jgi:hypothetical protein
MLYRLHGSLAQREFDRLQEIIADLKAQHDADLIEIESLRDRIRAITLLSEYK